MWYHSAIEKTLWWPLMSLLPSIRHSPAQPCGLVWALRAALLLMGFTFSVTQTVMLRAFLVAFSGNELSIGLILAVWLILEAGGSGFSAWPANRSGWNRGFLRCFRHWVLQGAEPQAFALLQVILALMLPLSLYAAFAVRRLAGITPGVGMGLGPMAWASLLILTPLGLVDGAMFACGCRIYARIQGPASTAGQVYSLEALGGIVGGLVLTYVFIPYLDALPIVLVLTTLNIASAVSLIALAGSRAALLRHAGGPLLALLAVAVYLLLFQSEGLQRRLERQQWPGYKLVFCDDSIYGNVAVIRQETQYTFFSNGIPTLTVPVPDVVLAEELVHLPLLFVAEPRRVLVIGGGAGGVLRELLKYPVEQVDYAELDPLLIEALRHFPTPLPEAELGDPRVQVHHVDGRLFVRERLASLALIPPQARGEALYDLILVNVSYPSTLELNRFYTREFFAMSRALLSADGVLVSRLPGSTEYLSPALQDQHATLQRTLQIVFPAVRPIPGDTTLWLASSSPATLDQPLDVLLSRWQARGIPTALSTGFHFQFKLDPRRLTWLQESLTQAAGPYVNEDLHPTGLLHGLAYWNEMFAPRVAGYFRFLHHVHLGTLLLPVVVLTPLAVLLLRSTPPRRAFTIPLAVLSTGFAGMAFDLLIIFAFQSFYGYVYYLIGLLTTAFMGGLTLGGWWMTWWVERAPAGRRLLLRLEGLLVGYWCLFPALLWLLYACQYRAAVAALLGPLLLLLNGLAGLLTGLEFPLANQLLLSLPSVSLRKRTTGGTASLLYAADLVGACSGALAVSLVFLPALGVVETCLLIAILKGASLLVLTLVPSS